MLTVNVKFYGFIKTVVQEASIEITIPEGASVADLLRVLGDRYGKGFTERVLDRQGGLQDWVRVLMDNDLLEDGNLDARLGATTGGPTRVVVYLLPAEIGG